MDKTSVFNLLRRTGAGALVLSATLFTGVARAGAGDIYTTVTPLASNVTYSSADGGFVAYLGFEVSLGSAPTTNNTVNDVVFTGTASATDPAEKPTFFAAYGVTCTTSNGGASISCPIGQLRAGQAYPTFAVFFKVPAQAVNGVADGPGTDNFKFGGITYYAEGTGGVPQSTPQNSTVIWPATPGATDVLLGTSNPTQIRSSVPKSGGKFYTGTGVSTGGDPFTTSVTVPSATFYTGNASILESTFGLDAGCVNFTLCYATDVSVPGSFEYLTIVLRQDQSTIKSGTKIESVEIRYDGSDTIGDSYHGNLGLCPSPTTPLSDRPCIAARKYYKNRSVSGWTAELDGDFEWTIISKKNGTLRIQ